MGTGFGRKRTALLITILALAAASAPQALAHPEPAPDDTSATAAETPTTRAANTSGEPSPGGEGPCTAASLDATPEGEGHDHTDIAQHRFRCRIEQVAFDSLEDELADRPDVLLGEMDVKADRAVIATSYPEGGFLLFDVADPSNPRFLSWYRSSECEGFVLDVDCGAYSWLSDDGNTVLLATQNISAIPGDFPQPGTSGVAKPTTVPGVEVVDVSRPELPLLSQTYVPASGVGGTHTARSHVIPDGPDNGPRAPGEYVFSVANGVGIEISKLHSLPGGAKLEPVHTIELDEAHDTFVQNDPVDERTYLYIAAGFSTGFLIYDVTDPADPFRLAEWDLTPECGEDWYSHTIDVAIRNGRRYLTMPTELIDMDLFGDQSEEDQAAGCGERVGNGEQAGPLWIVDVTDFSDLGQEGDSEEDLKRKSEESLVATWVNPEGQAGRNLLFSPHNQQIVGDKIYLSAYHAGIYVLDASAAFAGINERPSELGFIVPSGEPTRPFVDQEAGPLIPFFETFAYQRPNIWDMYFYKGYILTGDMTGGFYSFQYEGDVPVEPPAPAGAAGPPAPPPATSGPPGGQGQPGQRGSSPGESSRRGISFRIRRGRLGMRRGRVVRVPVSCPATERDGCQGTATVRYRRKVVAKRRYSLRAGQRRTLRVRIARRTARSMHRADFVRVLLEARDRQGPRTRKRARLVT